MISLSSLKSVLKEKEDSCSGVKNMLKYYEIRQSRVILIFVLIFVSLAWLYLSFKHTSPIGHQFLSRRTHCPKLLSRPRDHVAVQPYEPKFHSQHWMINECFQGAQPKDVDYILNSMNVWDQSKDPSCRSLYKDFRSIYQVRERIAEVTISDSFLEKVKHWLKGNKELIEKTKKQTLVFVDNLFTQESVVFNPVRSRRPGASGGDDTDILNTLIESTAKDCDFCRYKQLTAQDSFGILESEHAAIVSNTFKIEKYHGMILLKHHNPSVFSLEQFLDAMHLAAKWYRKTHELVPEHNFRHMYWDVYPKASASQVHPHLHVMLGSNEYYAKWNHFHIAALRYAQFNNGENYWTKMVEAHNSIGLAATYGGASALAYVTPQKDYCTFVISRKPDLDFFKMVYFVYRAFIDDMKLFAYSSGFVFPKLGANSAEAELPALFSVVYRGSLAGSRSDISSFDLFGTANVNVSPYKVIKAVQSSISKRKDEKAEMNQFDFS